MKKRKRWVYAMYKGDDILAIGTSDEICEQMNLNKKTFQFYRTNWYKKLLKNGRKGRYIIKLDDYE